MTKWWIGAVVLVVMCPGLLLLLGVGGASIEAANSCYPPRLESADQAGTGQAGTGTDLGVMPSTINAQPGRPVSGQVLVANANIKTRGGFTPGVRALTSPSPDFITLNEVGDVPISQMRSSAPGYDAYRDPVPVEGADGGARSMDNAIMWRTKDWSMLDGGRVRIVAEDHVIFNGANKNWGRWATWGLFKRSDGAVVAVIATHHMTNPFTRARTQWGNQPFTRAEQYSQGMDYLIKLAHRLAAYGPVLVGGDMNTSPSSGAGSAVAKLRTAGYRYTKDSGVMYNFFAAPVTVEKTWQMSKAAVHSDHPGLLTRMAMNNARARAGAVSSSRPRTATPVGRQVTGETTSPAASGAGTSGDVLAQLRKIRLSSGASTLTEAQARNAVAIAQVARQLRVPRYGLQIAIATAIQESTLNSLPGGDRDSAGLFQQRPSSGWGSHAQITDPTLAAQAFFGRAQHTNNTGLLDITGWSKMPLTQAAQAVQRSGFPMAYAKWEKVAGDITAVLGGDLPAVAAQAALGGCAAEAEAEAGGFAAGVTGDATYPVPAGYVGADRHNWHSQGSSWGSWHTGTDFSAPCGTPVYAAHGGTIEVDTTASWSGPWLVKVSSGPKTLTTWYAHMQRLTVARGQTVKPGQQIGAVGAEGNSTGCHLHFEVHEKNGAIYGPDNVDPSTWLAQNVSKNTDARK